MVRQFSDSQKQALAIAAGWQCEECGKPLPEEWHADHIVPYSKGGETDVSNGQALCPECNLAKGDEMSPRYNVSDPVDYNECGIELREWQREVRDDYSLQDAPQRYLISATPGAGKTYALGAIFHEKYGSHWSRLIVVTNSRERREGWVDDMAAMGIQLMEDFADNATVKDYHGCVITYDKMAGSVTELRRLCHQRDTLVAFDEIHHLGEKQTWGESAIDAFDQDTTRTIGLTGTPFRSDDNPIPFVEYEPDGQGNQRAVPDYEYDYSDALSDQVVRHVSFETWDGEFEWISDGESWNETFDDDIPSDEKPNRLRTALTEGKYRRDTIRDANERLEAIRQNDSDAGGLVVAKGQPHARDIAEEMRNMGHDPTVVVSDDSDARDKLQSFREGDGKWVVAVQMVSEGVDIKRLRVGVYLSNVTTDLFLRQVIGRVIRVEEDAEDTAWFWFPQDPRIMPTLRNIREMKRHVVEASQGDMERERDGDGDIDLSNFVAIDSEATEKQRIDPVVDELMTMRDDEIVARYDSAVLRLVEQMRKKQSSPSISIDGPSDKPWESYDSRHKKEEAIRKRNHNLAKKLAPREAPEAYSKDPSRVISRVHYRYNEQVGIQKTEYATVDQLERKAELLEEALRESQ